MTRVLKTQTPHSASFEAEFGAHDRSILLLQGGGALGAYHAGVYEGVAAAGFAPDWVVGISIGAINSALIAGNAPERRVERLREFWDLVSSQAPFVMPAAMDFARPTMNRMAAASAMFFGIPGFYVPRMPGAAIRSGRDSGRVELLRHGAVAGDARKAGRLRPHQRRGRPAVARRGQCAHRRVGLLRQHDSQDHGQPRDGERRTAAGIPAGGDRRRVLLRRRDHVELAVAVRRSRTSA